MIFRDAGSMNHRSVFSCKSCCSIFGAILLLPLLHIPTMSDPLFAPYEVQPNLVVNADPYTMTTGHLVGDRLEDIAVAHQQGNQITIIENDDGQMKVVQEISTDYAPFFILAGDFSNDGLDDLVVSNTIGDRIELYVNYGSAGFIWFNSYPTGDGPWNMAKGDFDNDGILDLVVANGWDQHIRVYYGSSSGGFYRVSKCFCGLGAGTVAPMYLDDDPFLDTVVLLEDNGLISFMINNGYGNMMLRDQIHVGGDAKDIALEDFNLDGAMDFAVITNDPYTTNDYLTTYLNDGTGHFSLADQCATGSYPVSILARDFDGDHSIELAVLGYESGGISTYHGNDEGEFAPLDFIPINSFTRGLSIFDIDGDGRQDLAIASRQSNRLYFLRNASDTTTESDLLSSAGFKISAYPNPLMPTTTLFYQQKRSGPLNLDLYDTRGRKIRTLLSGVTPQGSYTMKWDGRDDAGNELSSGVYLLRARSLTEANTMKLIKLK